MRIVGWNIRAGGGRRANGIAEQILEWRADLAVLSEFRGTGASTGIALHLAQAGLTHQRHTCSRSEPARNALLIASRWPLRRAGAAQFHHEPQRWLRVNVLGPERFSILGLHVPNRHTGRKYPFFDAVSEAVASWTGHPGLVIGDTNSGRRGIDEENPAFNRVEEGWIDRLEGLGWRDAFRMHHPQRREFTWYSPNGRNGFRLDQAFVHPRLCPRLTRVAHDWGEQRLSDHAALIVDFDKG